MADELAAIMTVNPVPDVIHDGNHDDDDDCGAGVDAFIAAKETVVVVDAVDVDVPEIDVVVVEELELADELDALDVVCSGVVALVVARVVAGVVAVLAAIVVELVADA